MGFVEGIWADYSSQAEDIKSKAKQPEAWFSVIAEAKKADGGQKYTALSNSLQTYSAKTPEVTQFSDRKKEALATADTADDTAADAAASELKKAVIADIATFYEGNVVYIKDDQQQMTFYYKRTWPDGQIDYVLIGNVDAAEQQVFNALIDDLNTNAKIDAKAFVTALQAEEKELQQEVVAANAPAAWQETPPAAPAAWAEAPKKEPGAFDLLLSGDFEWAAAVALAGPVTALSKLQPMLAKALQSNIWKWTMLGGLALMIVKWVSTAGALLWEYVPRLGKRTKDFTQGIKAMVPWLDLEASNSSLQLAQSTEYPEKLKKEAAEKIILTAEGFISGLVAEWTAVQDLERVTGIPDYAWRLKQYADYQKNTTKNPQDFIACIKDTLMSIETAADGGLAASVEKHPNMHSSLIAIAAYRTDFWKEKTAWADNIYELKAVSGTEPEWKWPVMKRGSEVYKAYPEGWFVQWVADFYADVTLKIKQNPEITTPEQLIESYYPGPENEQARNKITQIMNENKLKDNDTSAVA